MEAKNIDYRKVKEAKDIDEVKLPGFRFHPTDEELVGFYLRRKVDQRPISIELIRQIDIYKYDPWDLPKTSSVGEKEWYFFCIRGRKYRNSIRPNRVTVSGFWKATGIDKPIYSTKQQPPICIGLKKTLVYYRGSAGKGSKTDWMMHEFRLPPDDKQFPIAHCTSQEAEVWTLCRIFKRTPSSKKYTAEAELKLDATLMKSKVTDSETCSSLQQQDYYENRGQGMNFCDSSLQNNSKPYNFMDQADARNYCLLGGTLPRSSSMISAIAHEGAPFEATINYPTHGSYPINSEVDVFTNVNWDELRPVVEMALQPYIDRAFDCT